MISEDLEGEAIFPIGPAYMKDGAYILICLSNYIGIVFDFNFPKFRFYLAEQMDDISCKPLDEINDVDTLIQQFAASAESFGGSPFFFHTRPAAMAVEGADIQNFANFLLFDQLPGFRNGWMKTMIKPCFEHDPRDGIASGACDRMPFLSIPSQRFLDQYVFAGTNSR